MNLKIVGKNTIIYGIGNIGLRASAFLLIPLYTHTLSVKEYGLLSTLLLTIQLMIILMSVGMRTSFLRFSKEYESRNLMGELLVGCLLINVIVCIVIAGVTVLFLKPFFRSILHIDQVGGYLVLTSCAAVAQTLSLQVMSYYQSRNEALKFSIVGGSAALLLFITNLILLVILKAGLRGALIASIITYSSVFMFVFVDVLLKKTGIGISVSMLPRLFRFGFPLVFSMLGQSIMGTSSIYFLGYYEGLEVVAVYSLGYKLATIVGIVLTLPFQLAYQPFIFQNIGKHELKDTMGRLFIYFIIGVAIISCIIIMLSRMFLPFIAPPDYSWAYLVIILVLPAVAFNGLIIFGETLLSIAKKTHVMGIVVGICGLLSVFLNYLLVPRMGWYGAIIASNVSCLSAGLVILILGKKAFPMTIEWLRAIMVIGFIATVLLLAFVLHTANNLIFYGMTISTTFIFGFLLIIGKFFSDQERATLKYGLDWIRLRLST